MPCFGPKWGGFRRAPSNLAPIPQAAIDEFWAQTLNLGKAPVNDQVQNRGQSQNLGSEIFENGAVPCLLVCCCCCLLDKRGEE